MNNTNKSKSAAEKPKQTPPGLANSKSQKEFPALPETSETPVVPFAHPVDETNSELVKFSDIVDWIPDTFNVPDPIKVFLTAVLPTVRTFLKQLTAQWPLLAAIVSFVA